MSTTPEREIKRALRVLAQTRVVSSQLMLWGVIQRIAEDQLTALKTKQARKDARNQNHQPGDQHKRTSK